MPSRTPSTTSPMMIGTIERPIPKSIRHPRVADGCSAGKRIVSSPLTSGLGQPHGDLDRTLVRRCAADGAADRVADRPVVALKRAHDPVGQGLPDGGDGDVNASGARELVAGDGDA